MMRGAAFCATLAAALAALGTGALAQGPDWRRLGRDGPFEVAVDVATFDGPRTRRTARSVLVSLEGEDSSYHNMILNVGIDCDARTISALDVQVFDDAGLVLGEGPVEPDTRAVSETDGTATLARAICDGEGLADRRFESARAFAAWALAQPGD